VFIMKEISWENNLNVVQGVSVMYIHFIVIIIIVSEKKEALLFLPSPV
jgi:hypothetical protein